jgi:Tol biopolymer transport system component/DNA-binding winged helix-turn-helix (wHTH) protein
MALPLPESRRLTFGVFTADPSLGRLLKDGIPVKLAPQPFKVLLLLIERRGGMVGREEIREHLWGNSTFVDFERGINFSINQIRAVLCDDVERPRYIETLPKIGYRFVAEVREQNGHPDSAMVGKTSPIFGPLEGTEPAPSNGAQTSGYHIATSTHGDIGKTRPASKVWIAAAIVVLITLTVTFFGSSRPFSPPKVIRSVQITHDGFDKTNSLSDGSRLYITESTGSRQFLVQVSVAGGERSVIPTPFASIAISDVSPDHSQMLVTDAVGTENESQIWVLPLPTGTPRRLGDIVAHWNLWSAGWAVWFPDGRRIAFTKGSEIYTAKADGTDVRKLVSFVGSAEQMRFSPDGTRLRFTVKDPQSEARSIWEVRADGSDLHLLFPERPRDFSDLAGDWSPDGRYYFFTSCSDPNPCGLWASREPKGFLHGRPSPPVQLTVGPTPVFLNGISRDGKKLFVGEWTSRGELVRYDAKSRQFLPFLAGMDAEQVDFSRDGKWVTYISNPDQTLWRSRVDGSQRMQLTSSAVSASLPRWSPDGKHIAYVDQHAGAFSKIFVISEQGGAPQEMLAEDQNQLDPSWSPNGEQLAFGRAPWLSARMGKIDIRILDLYSKEVSTIPGSDDLFYPRWSPDGQYLAAVSSDSKKLLLFDFKTRKWTNWIDEPGAVAFPAWSADGRYIFFDNISSENPGYRRVRVGQNHSELLVSLKDLHRGIASQRGPWSGIATDDSPLFERDLSTGEIYSLEMVLP